MVGFVIQHEVPAIRPEHQVNQPGHHTLNLAESVAAGLPQVAMLGKIANSVVSAVHRKVKLHFINAVCPAKRTQL